MPVRVATQQPKKGPQSSKDQSDSAELSFPETGVTMTNLRAARMT